MNDYIYSLLQGLVQGLTEFLPISSSGHLEFFQHVTNSADEGHLLFSVLLHLGTLIAVLVVYRKKLAGLIVEFFSMMADIFKKRFQYDQMSGKRRMVVMIFVTMIPLPLVLVLDKLVELIAGGTLYVAAFSFMFNGVLMFLAAGAARVNSKNRFISFQTALAIGVMQAVAGGFPAISRSGATIAIALLLGLRKETAVDFSFIIGIPAILAAGGYELLESIVEKVPAGVGTIPILLGIVVSTVVGIFAIQLLRILVKKDKFQYFGYYNIAIGLVCLGISIYETIVK